MDVAIGGVHWWSLIILEGYSRTMLAGMIAPTEATWVALMVLYTACLRYGAPASLVSDSGGAYTSADFEAVCTRLQIQHETIISTQGESYQNWMEPHFNVQRRLYDDQFSLARTPPELEQRHQAFIQTYNTTAHQGLLKDRRLPPIPVEVLGTARGRVYTPAELARHFAQAVLPRTTNRHGCVTLHSYHFYVEEGLPCTQVLLWVSGEQLRAVFDHVVLAEYRCRVRPEVTVLAVSAILERARRPVMPLTVAYRDMRSQSRGGVQLPGPWRCHHGLTSQWRQAGVSASTNAEQHEGGVVGSSHENP